MSSEFVVFNFYLNNYVGKRARGPILKIANSDKGRKGEKARAHLCLRMWCGVCLGEFLAASPGGREDGCGQLMTILRGHGKVGKWGMARGEWGV